MPPIFSITPVPIPSMKPKNNVDCTLIGATFATMITAIQLADAGLSVQILEEKSGLGFGDSGKTLLPASLSFTDNLFRLHASLGEEKCRSILDVMQTIPSFVYLIPVVMLLGIGKVPGLIAVCIYAIPPIVRLTNLGIRLVDKDVLEAADSFGANYWQKLFGVQIPLALPTIFAGVNQTIMMALAMVVIASMIGVKGLGLPVLQAISNQYLALGLMNGLAIVILAIIFDRVTQKFGLRMQKYRNEGKD